MRTKPLRVTDESLEEADRQLAMLEDVTLEEEGRVPGWVVAARHAVQQARRGDAHD